MLPMQTPQLGFHHIFKVPAEFKTTIIITTTSPSQPYYCRVDPRNFAPLPASILQPNRYHCWDLLHPLQLVYYSRTDPNTPIFVLWLQASNRRMQQLRAARAVRIANIKKEKKRSI